MKERGREREREHLINGYSISANFFVAYQLKWSEWQRVKIRGGGGAGAAVAAVVENLDYLCWLC